MAGKRKKKLRADDPLRDLTKAVRRLDPEQGMVARRNARADVLGELKRLREFVDKEYPAIRKTSGRRKPKRGLARVRALQREGWGAIKEKTLPVFCEWEVLKLPVARVKLLRVEENQHRAMHAGRPTYRLVSLGSGYRKVKVHEIDGRLFALMVPKWLVHLSTRHSPAAIAAMSPTERKAVEMEMHMEGEDT